MSEAADVEIYRRRRSRNECGDRQRVIGGLGRRRPSQSSGIKDRIQQFKDHDRNTPSPSSPAPRRRNEDIERVTPRLRKTSVDSSDAISPLPRRRRMPPDTTKEIVDNDKNKRNAPSGERTVKSPPEWRSRLQKESILTETKDERSNGTKLDQRIIDEKQINGTVCSAIQKVKTTSTNTSRKASASTSIAEITNRLNNNNKNKSDVKNYGIDDEQRKNASKGLQDENKNNFSSLRRKNQANSSMSSEESLSKISSIKNRLYDINNNDSDGKSFDSDSDRSKKPTSSNNSTKIGNLSDSPRSSFDNTSKFDSLKSKFSSKLDDSEQEKSIISSHETHVETTSSVSSRRREANSIQKTTLKSIESNESNFVKKSNIFEKNNHEIKNKTPTRKSSSKSVDSKFKSDIEINVSSPGLTRKTIQSERKLTSGFETSKIDLNVGNNSKQNKQELTKDLDHTDYSELSPIPTDDVFKKLPNHDEQNHDMNASDILNNNTGVTKLDSGIHAEKKIVNQSESSEQQKSRGDISFSPSKTDSSIARKSLSNDINGLKDESTLEKNHKGYVNIISRKKLNSENNYAAFQKVTERRQTRDRSNTWTTTDSEDDRTQSELNVDKKLTLNSNSSDSSDKEPNRRRKLTKKRSKKSKNKPQIIPKKNSQLSIDTSDGDILESNYTSDDCGNQSAPCDTDINSDGDILDVKSTNKTLYSSTAKENTENLTSQSSEQKNNSIIESGYNNKKEDLAKLTDILQNRTNDGSVMKSSSMTTVSRLQSLSSYTDMGGSKSEDEGARISNWSEQKIKDGPHGSFTSISRVSTLQLKSFTGKSFSPLLKRRTLSSEDKPYTTASYSEISSAPNGITKDPFNIDRVQTFVSRDNRHSDGEQELTSRLEKQEEKGIPPFQRSMTLPRNMRLREGLDIRKNPFSIVKKSKEEQEESKRAAEVLKNLPDAPFALIGRYTRDVQKMQSRSTGSLARGDNKLKTIEKDINFDIDDEESQPVLKTNETRSMNQLSSSMLATVKDLMNNNVQEEKAQEISEPFIAPPDNFRDEGNNKTQSRVRNRPPLNISSITTEEQGNEILSDDEYYRQLQESPAPRRRPSYIIAQSADELDDPMSMFSIPKVSPPPDESQDNIDISKVSKQPPKHSRPRLPGMLTNDTLEEKDTVKKDDSDSDEIAQIDFSKADKVKSVHKLARPRPPLAQAPILEGIIEEEGQGLKRGIHDEPGKKRRPRRPVIGAIFPEDTIIEEPSRDIEYDSPKNDERETGSQGSDLHSTPKNLSSEDISSEIDYDSKFDNVNGEVRSKSDPNPTAITQYNENISNYNEPNTNNNIDLNLSQNLKRHPSNSSTTSLGVKDKSLVSISNGIGTSEPPDPPDTPVTPTSPQEIGIEKPPAAPTKEKTPKAEMRRHVLQNLLDTERSYVHNLGAMLTMFFKPLKRPENGHIIEPSLVDEIFYQIPEILVNHEFFLEQLTNRVNAWSDEQIIGDIFVSSFTKCLLMDAYSNFINHFVQAKTTIRQATNARPQFVKYIEQCTKEHKEKLTLSDLLIMPVQRIPRYCLILKDMLKYTPTEHPDFGNLKLALDEIKTLADRMNKGEVEADQAERDVERLRDIEATIEGMVDLVNSNRKFLRQDLVAELKGAVAKKDRCLFLFSDLLVCTTVRRKTHALRRGSLGLFTGQSAAELNRYKFLWKLPLDDVDISKANNPQPNVGGRDIERLEEDVRILTNILSEAESLTVSHQNLEFSVKDLMTEVRNQIQEKQTQTPQIPLSPMLSKIELIAQIDDVQEFYTFVFLSAECKSSWEAYFEEAKQKLAYSRDTFPPEFQYPMPITKTRSGMQFTCAAPSHVNGFSDIMNQPNICGDVWVCNSDGYVGQVCLLSMIPEAQSKACLSVCSARIVCVAAVPGARLNSDKPRTDGDRNNLHSFSQKKIKSSKSTSSFKQKKSVPSESDDDDIGHGAENIIAFDSSDDDDADMGTSFIGGSSAFGGRMSPDGSSLGTVGSIEGDHDSSDFNSSDDEDDHTDSTRRMNAPVGSSLGRSNNGYPMKDSLDDFLDEDLDVQATMWLGTEDGHIYVYHAKDAITQRKSKLKMQHGFPVISILYFENKVFVALGSGELCIYKRESGTSGWQISTPETIHVSITGSAIVCMTAVAGRIWCGCQNTIVLVNASTLKIERPITVSPDHTKSVHKIVSSGLGVWVSLQNSATVRLYHATTYENLLDIDVASAVNKMLAGADQIIKQHKAACLRVTSLLICKDLIWIGTSAGVILTNQLPSINVSTSVLRHSPGPTGSPHGHTGHVRFLTSVEVPRSMFKGLDPDKDIPRGSPMTNNARNKKKDVDKNKLSDTDNNDTVTLVVSGGDGYEDFRYNQQSEAVGRDDSTNHLLIWRV